MERNTDYLHVMSIRLESMKTAAREENNAKEPKKRQGDWQKQKLIRMNKKSIFLISSENVAYHNYLFLILLYLHVLCFLFII